MQKYQKTMRVLLIIMALMATIATKGNATTHGLTDDEAGRTALLMVHFGTTHDDTRQLTIDAVNNLARQDFPQAEVREAYTSRIVIKRLAQRGIVRQTPLEALLQLRADGFERVVVQPTHIIPGEEYATLLNDVRQVEHLFKYVRVGKPLLYTLADCREMAGKLTAAHATEKHTHVVFVGHGTEHPANAVYSQMDRLMKQCSPRCHVGTIEGFPALDDVVQQLRQAKARCVVLVPLMFVAGDHAKNDISVEWKEALEKEGFNGASFGRSWAKQGGAAAFHEPHPIGRFPWAFHTAAIDIPSHLMSFLLFPDRTLITYASNIINLRYVHY